MVCLILHVSLFGQVTNSVEPQKENGFDRKSNFNVEELKVRWKKVALENCTGVPCTIVPPPPSFTCGTSTVADIDNNIYNTVAIGTQCWTTTNLKVTKYNDGTLIFDGTLFNNAGFAGLGALGTGALSGASSYVATYGYLYNWYAVNNSRKLCPVGWHVPTDGEWTSLIQFIDNPTVINPSIIGVQSASAGGKLKAIGTPWSSGSPGTDNYGFTALPGGARDSGGAFFGVANYAFFWSATESNPSDFAAWYRSFEYSNTNVGRSAAPNFVKRAAFSVRCLED